MSNPPHHRSGTPGQQSNRTVLASIRHTKNRLRKISSTVIPALKNLVRAVAKQESKPEQSSSSLLAEGQSLANKLTRLEQLTNVLSALWTPEKDNSHISAALQNASRLIANFSFDQDEVFTRNNFAKAMSLLENAELNIAQHLVCMAPSQLNEVLDNGDLDYQEVLRLRRLTEPPKR